jgi:hypothetical protein
MGRHGRGESEGEKMAWKWVTLTVLAIFAGSWIGYLTLKALNGFCYELEIMRRYLAEDEDAE